MSTPEVDVMKVWMQFYIARIRASKSTVPSSGILASDADRDFEEYQKRLLKIADVREKSRVR